ncbi:MAG: hypothetical protein ACREBD_10715 [Blastocatellia bacterium]
MGASHRRLPFRFSYAALLLITLCCVGGAGSAFAQGIQGLPGSATDAALGFGVSENKLGSVLFFNYYTSDAASAQINTRINITNVNPTRDIAVHVFFIDNATCSIADAFICLTRNQTTSFVVSDLDPNVTGYLIVVAVDSQGHPVGFNFLAGDELVVTATAHRFGLAAMAAARRDGAVVSPVNSDGVTATMFFDNWQYDALPYAMVLDSFPSQVGGIGAGVADTRLYIYSPLPDLVSGGPAFSGTIFFIIRDDQENSFSGQLPLDCFLASDKQRISSIRTSPNINTIVPSGRTGWAAFYAFGNRTIVCNTSGDTVSLTNVPLMGATATKVGSGATAITGGHNLRYATTFNAPGYSITLPVFSPGCPSVDFDQSKGSSLCDKK